MGRRGFLYLLHGLGLWGRASLAEFARAQFDDAGLHLRLGTRKKPRESFFAWEQIGEIYKQQAGGNWVITVSGKGEDYAWYTPYDVFRYMKTAKMISARWGVGITQLPPYKAPAKDESGGLLLEFDAVAALAFGFEEGGVGATD